MGDIEETARLVLMDLPVRSLGAFLRELRDYHPNASVVTIQDLWDRYMGRAGYVLATHDLETGERLR